MPWSWFSEYWTLSQLFNSPLSLSAIRVVSSAYLKLLIFLQAALIPASASFSPAFHMMYSAYKLNKQGDNIQPWRTPFPIWNFDVFLSQLTGRPDTKAEAPILQPPDAKSQHIGKDPDVGKDWRQKEKGTVEDEMAREHHQLNGHEFEQTSEDSGGQRSLACYSSWGHKELDTT